MKPFTIEIAGKPVAGFETHSRRRALRYVQVRYPTAYKSHDYRIIEPPVGATIRWIVS